VPSRVEVRSMTDAQLSSFRQAFTASIDIGTNSAIDNRGYAYWAGLHGLPSQYCAHGNLFFLPWHRAYLYLFEKSLQDQVPGVTLPWWDWTSAASHQEGIPDSYQDAQADNPLQSAPVSLTPDLIDLVRQNLPGAITDGPDPTTVRYPQDPSDLPRADTVQAILDNDSRFDDFSTQLENIHNGVHTWVRGSMSQIPVAGFDPVFWAHHAMIDRLWYLWQQQHPNGSLDPSMLDAALTPFPFTVAQVLDIGPLGYDYAVAAIT
jgi:tyrosinase